jgi:hypothetical protein
MTSGVCAVRIFTNIRSSNDRFDTVFPLDCCNGEIAGGLLPGNYRDAAFTNETLT